LTARHDGGPSSSDAHGCLGRMYIDHVALIVDDYDEAIGSSSMSSAST
jgi:hypothetical protein